jgi:hypothetical protein
LAYKRPWVYQDSGIGLLEFDRLAIALRLVRSSSMYEKAAPDIKSTTIKKMTPINNCGFIF